VSTSSDDEHQQIGRAIMKLGPAAQAVLALAPSVGLITLAFAAIDTMIALTIELVRPACEAEGVQLKRTRETTARIKELNKAIKTKALENWRNEAEIILIQFAELKEYRDLICHGQLQVNNINLSDTLLFSKVNPNRDRSAQEAEITAVSSDQLKRQAQIALKLQAKFLLLVVSLSERPGGWTAP
jgi:hypothetical protein